MVRRDEPEVLHLLGLALHQQGGDEEALDCLSRLFTGYVVKIVVNGVAMYKVQDSLSPRTSVK